MKERKNMIDGYSMNMAYVAINRPCKEGLSDKNALIWTNYVGEKKKFTFGEMAVLSDRFSAGLKAAGVQKGDRIFIYMEKIPQCYTAILGIVKCGAVACPLFSGFGKTALLERINDSEGSYIITSEKLSSNIFEVAEQIRFLKAIIIHDIGKTELPKMIDDVKFLDYNDVLNHPGVAFIEKTSAEDLAIMHYTSGTTGKPKGAVHRHASITAQRDSIRDTFNIAENEVYWCTADPGWITGTSYGIFGPWAAGITQFVYDGGFDAEKWYEIIDEFGVNVLYTSPTAIRQLMKETGALKKYVLKSLKRIYSVGEPLNPEAIEWAKKNIGLSIYDTWFQTETGTIMSTNKPGLEIKKGSMGKPRVGIEAKIVDALGNEVGNNIAGDLVLRPDFPSLFVSYWNKKELYESRFKNGFYYTGDRASVDSEGYFWFISRNDDVMKVSGHLLGPFEVESALLEIVEVAESAVIGLPDFSLGEVPAAFIVLKKGIIPDRKLEIKIKTYIRQKIAAYAVPQKIKFVEKLPKTRSGKIMRRMLKNLELGIPVGDTSTLEE